MLELGIHSIQQCELAPVVHKQVFGLLACLPVAAAAWPRWPAATFQWAAQAPLINTSPHVLQILCATSNPQVSQKIYNPFQYLEATEGFGEGRNTDFGCFYTLSYKLLIIWPLGNLYFWLLSYQFEVGHITVRYKPQFSNCSTSIQIACTYRTHLKEKVQCDYLIFSNVIILWVGHPQKLCVNSRVSNALWMTPAADNDPRHSPLQQSILDSSSVYWTAEYEQQISRIVFWAADLEEECNLLWTDPTCFDSQPRV